MKKKQVVYLVAFLFLAFIVPNNASAKELSNEKIICNYQYKDTTLTYRVYNDKVEPSFKDGTNNMYHGQDFTNDYLKLAKVNSVNYICPTITIEESDLFTTVFTKPRNEKDCNGTCTTIGTTKTIANKNITVKKAVDSTAIGSVGIYKDEKYFIPYFRLLEDGTKEWSINGKTYQDITESFTIKVSDETIITIKLDSNLVKEIYKDNKLNSDITIYRNVKKTKKNNYEYLLSTTIVSSYDLKDEQLTEAKAYVGAYGDPQENDRMTKEEMDEWLDGYDQNQDCGDNGLLGNVNDEDSVAWLLQKILNYLKIIGPFIVVVMSGIDFTKVIVTSDDDSMKKAQKKLVIRLLLAGSLFFLPQIVIALLDIFGITSDATCGLH